MSQEEKADLSIAQVRRFLIGDGSQEDKLALAESQLRLRLQRLETLCVARCRKRGAEDSEARLEELWVECRQLLFQTRVRGGELGAWPSRSVQFRQIMMDLCYQ